jgi:PAS domain-containing protein
MDERREDRRDAPASGSVEPDYPSPTTGQQIEVILARQLAGYLTLPIVIMDPNRTAVYYNEPAERLLGRRFDEGGPVRWSQMSTTFPITDEDGTPLSVDETPLGIALNQRRLSSRTYWLQGIDGTRHHVNTTAIPLVGNAGRFLGVIAIFDKVED